MYIFTIIGNVLYNYTPHRFVTDYVSLCWCFFILFTCRIEVLNIEIVKIVTMVLRMSGNYTYMHQTPFNQYFCYLSIYVLISSFFFNA